MIIRDWKENGEQCHMFETSVYCRVCKCWSAYFCVTLGDRIECGNPTCKVKGVVTERHGVYSLGRQNHS